MSEPESRSDSTPVQLLPVVKCDVSGCLRALLQALADIHELDAELRQLWLEIHWIKSDYEQGVLSIPRNWELTIMKIARGELTPSVRRHPNVVQAARNLAIAIKAQLRKTVE